MPSRIINTFNNDFVQISNILILVPFRFHLYLKNSDVNSEIKIKNDNVENFVACGVFFELTKKVFGVSHLLGIERY